MKKLQQKLKAATGHDCPEIIILVRPAGTPVTPVCQYTMYNRFLLHKIIYYLIDGNPHIPMPMRIAMLLYLPGLLDVVIARGHVPLDVHPGNPCYLPSTAPSSKLSPCVSSVGCHRQ